jgi:phosphomannomutase/phosphoglucomutase
MVSPKQLFGTNGIRGVVNKELDSLRTVKIGSAIGTYFKNQDVIVGHDARTSSPMLVKAIIAGLNATGCNVFFAGMTPTPALQYAVKNLKKEGAVIITASHNPPEYNGIKVVGKDGIELSREKEIEVENIFFNEKMKYSEWNCLGTIQELPGIIDQYKEAIKKHVNVENIKKKRFHVVVDAANSVGSLALPSLLREMGCRVITINADIDGAFPGRLPEPSPQNLGVLASTVRALGADLGVALDGDADRAIFVDEKGEVHWGDKSFALIEKKFLQDNPGEKIVTPVSSSILIKDVADDYCGEIIWTKVGSVTVSQTMKKVKAKLGGEENGGIFYGPHQSVRDGGMATALLLDIMTKKAEKLSKIIDGLPKYFIQKDKVKCPHELKEKILKRLIKQCHGLNIETIDGVKMFFKNKSSVLMRPSGTEPVYRLYVEAKTEEVAKKLVQKYGLKIKKIIRSLKE